MKKTIYLLLGLLIPCNLVSTSYKGIPPVEHQKPYLTFRSLNAIIRELQVIHRDDINAFLEGIRAVLAEDYVRHLHDHRFDGASLANHYINVLGQAPNAGRLFLLLVGFLQAAENDPSFTSVELARMEEDAEDLAMEANARMA